MNRFQKILIWLMIVIAVLFGLAVVLVRVKGKEVIAQHARRMLHRPVTFDSVSLRFPCTLQFEGLNIENLLQVKEASVRVNPTALIGGEVFVREVYLNAPVLTLHRSLENQILWAETLDDAPMDTAKSVSGQSARPVKAVIGRLQVHDGQLHFSSIHAGHELNVALDSIELSAAHVPLSGQPMDVRFDFSGVIQGADAIFTNDHVQGSGWINWPERNMDATFKIMDPDEKIALEANLNSKNNDMAVRGHLRTRSLGSGQADESKESIQDLALKAMRSTGMDVGVDFNFLVKMDNWELSKIDFSGNLIRPDSPVEPQKSIENLKIIGKEFQAVGEKIFEKYVAP